MKRIITIAPCILLLIMLSGSCAKEAYEIPYQDGYPNSMAGNWIAVDYQLTKEVYDVVVDSINRLNLENSDHFRIFASLLKITDLSEEYSLSTALSPNDTDSILIISNLYNTGIRFKATYSRNLVFASLADQLEVIDKGQYDIHFVTISGQKINVEEQDALIFVAGLYDKEMALFESLVVIAYRKTGFEDTKYQSLLRQPN